VPRTAKRVSASFRRFQQRRRRRFLARGKLRPDGDGDRQWIRGQLIPIWGTRCTAEIDWLFEEKCGLVRHSVECGYGTDGTPQHQRPERHRGRTARELHVDTDARRQRAPQLDERAAGRQIDEIAIVSGPHTHNRVRDHRSGHTTVFPPFVH